MRIPLLFAALAAMIPPTAAAQPADRESLFVFPPVVEVPTQAQIEAVTSAAGDLRGVPYVQMTCGFDGDGRLTACADPDADDERRKAWEAAALKLVPHYRLDPRFVQQWPGVRPKVVVNIYFGPQPRPEMLPPVIAAPPAPAAPVRNRVIARPDWIRKPSAEAIAKVYPKAARSAAVDGRAVLMCVAKADGGLTDCVLDYETPAGQGFGEAAVKLSRHYRMRPTMSDGSSVAGGRVRVPVFFYAAGEPQKP